MQWPPKLSRGSRLIIGDRGYYARLGGRQRWVCGRKPPAEAERILLRKSGVIASGHKPLPEIEQDGGPITLYAILNRWIIERREDFVRGELKPGSWQQYKLSCKRIITIAGHYVTDDIFPDHIKAIYTRLCEDHGADFAKRALSHLRTACNHAAEFGWCRPIRFGGKTIAKLVERPPARMKWKLHSAGELQSVRDELERRIKSADGRSRPALIQLRAMFYLALNGGYGAKELSDLPRAVIDLDNQRIDYARGKTGKDHTVPLWDETVKALREALKLRPGDELAFRTREGNPWCETKPVYVGGKLDKVRKTDNVNERWKDLIRDLGIRVKSQGFYKLKHIHCTAADDANDPHATFALAGHGLPGAKGHYVRVSEQRVWNVVAHIHRSVFTKRVQCSNRKTAAAADSIAAADIVGRRRQKPAYALTGDKLASPRAQ